MLAPFMLKSINEVAGGEKGLDADERTRRAPSRPRVQRAHDERHDLRAVVHNKDAECGACWPVR